MLSSSESNRPKCSKTFTWIKSSSVLAQVVNDFYLTVTLLQVLGQYNLAICENVYAELDLNYNMLWLQYTS